jgi:hypothetical protein
MRAGFQLRGLLASKVHAQVGNALIEAQSMAAGGLTSIAALLSLQCCKLCRLGNLSG